MNGLALRTWRGKEKYYVEIDILPVLPEVSIVGEASWQGDRSVDGEIGDGRSADTAMEDA